MLNGWPSAPTSRYFNGTIDEVSNYPTVLTATQVRARYVAGTSGAAAAAPLAIDPDGAVSPDATGAAP